MKKFSFLLILVFLGGSLFAQTAADYDKILRGDFSAFVGYWVNDDDNSRIFILPDGGEIGAKSVYGSSYRVGRPTKTNGFYTWLAGGGQEGYYVRLFPIGIEIEGIKTDTTKTRLYFSYDGWRSPFEAKRVYYKETEFPATHLVLEDIQLKKSPQPWDSENIAGTVKKGTMVLWAKGWKLHFATEAERNKWARIYTPDGLEGYCPSNTSSLEQKIEIVFPSTFTGMWKRNTYNNTLTFTESTVAPSGSEEIWKLSWLYGDSYTISYTGLLRTYTATITIRFVDGNLEISGDSGTGENNWNGVWKKQ